jgi:hypothetical protein
MQNRIHYISPDGKKYYFWQMLQSYNNVGIPQIKFIEDSGPQQHGVNVRDWRINPRTITLEFFKEGETCCQTGQEISAEIINIIRPNRGTSPDVNGFLRFINDNWKMMEIPAFVLQGPNGNFEYGGPLSHRQVQDAVQFYCPDPIWREVEKKTVIVTGDNWGDSCLPMCLYSTVTPQNNHLAGCLVPYSYIMQNIEIIYDGTWAGDQIDITLTGPMETPTITNTTTGKQIQLDYEILSGNYVIITIRPEYATVVDQDGNNLIGVVTNISDLVDFELAVEGSITPDGKNNITVSAVNSVVAETQIKIEYYIRHISAFGKPAC